MSTKNTDLKSYEETFYIAPRYIRKLPGMTLAFLDVYETMFQFWNKGLTCYLTNPAIMERTGLGHTQVSDALKFFETNNELKREHRGSRRYLIQPEKSIDNTEITQPTAPAVCGINITQHTAPAVLTYRSSGTLPTAGAVPEYKEVNIKKLTTSREEETPQKQELIEIRKTHPFSVLLSDKYLLAQNALNADCLNDEKCLRMFQDKFNKLEVTIEEMLGECVMYYALKPITQNVSAHRFRAWIKNEHTSTYEKKPDSMAHKLWRDLTELEKILLADYNHFMKWPELKSALTEIEKSKARKLLEMLNTSKNLKELK